MTQLVLQEQYRTLVLKTAHRPGHLGRDNTKAQVFDDYYWLGLDRDVRNHCKACPQYQKTAKKRKKFAPLQTMPIISTLFSRIAMDFVGAQKAGNMHVLVIMDYATRWPEAIPLKNMCR